MDFSNRCDKISGNYQFIIILAEIFGRKALQVVNLKDRFDCISLNIVPCFVVNWCCFLFSLLQSKWVTDLNRPTKDWQICCSLRYVIQYFKFSGLFLCSMGLSGHLLGITVPPSLLWIRMLSGTWIPSCEEVIQLAYATLVVLLGMPTHAWNNAQRGTRGLPPPRWKVAILPLQCWFNVKLNKTTII